MRKFTTFSYCLLFGLLLTAGAFTAEAQGTRLLRQPTISENYLAFVYGGDIWRSDLDGQNVRRITSTPAVESDPHFSPDGKWLAFTSNRSGGSSVYIVPVAGGNPTRLTWHPSASGVRGWTADGKHVLYASTRESAPVSYNKLWTVPATGGPSVKVSEQWGYDGSYSEDGKRIIIDKMSRWDTEWRAYRGGQNTPLILLDLSNQSEVLLPNESTTDIQPLWLGDEIFFLSDRDWTMNVWAYSVDGGQLRQVTDFKATDVKSLGGHDGQLIVEQNGYLHTVDPASGDTRQLEITVIGDFPWAEPKWEDVSSRATAVSLSPSGKRALMEARGEIFTVPVEYGDPRNLTQSSGAADRNPIWSPKKDQIAWFSDAGGKGYALHLTDQDGMSESKTISIGESKLAWDPVWSPDGAYIAFVDDDVRIQVLELESGKITTADVGGNNLDRSRSGLAWAADSKKLAYVKSGENNFRRIMVYDLDTQKAQALTDPFADAFAPAWDRDQKHLYFLASTELALGSGWANTSAMQADPDYAAYVIVLQKGEDSPFVPRSDEEEVEKEKKEEKEEEAAEKEEEKEEDKDKDDKEAEKDKKDKEKKPIVIDYEQVERRTIALPMPTANYRSTVAGPEGVLFVTERKPGSSGLVLHKFTLKERKAKEFETGVRQVSVSADAKKILTQTGSGWKVSNTGGNDTKGGKSLSVKLNMKLDRMAEWRQMFEEAWRYERDYFYDPGMHGRNWQTVYERYAPLVPYIRHRSDLTSILDQINGELSVGHSFVFGGDYPETDRSVVGLLGADLEAHDGRWRITRIYTTESWNPTLSSPLDRPGLKVETGNYLVGVNGQELTADSSPFEWLDGTAGRQTTIHINDKPSFEGAWTAIVEPIRSENALRQRGWVEDNRRLVDRLSNGRLAYIWVPNTSGGGFVSFNRYYFAQQDKEGAVIDERFNGGGLLDDYMVDLMTRSLRAAITNEVPNGKAFRLPAGILGPKVLLINERAGSGGDFFPWVFRQQEAGPLIGARTWGGLVKSSVHYGLVDGGALTAPDNAVFDPINNKFIGENEGIAPDIPVRQDAKALSEGRDPQLERAVQEVLRMLEQQRTPQVTPPPFNTPAVEKK
ncbi:S41 family peptidase [Flavilitoribacter nigricans]|uniref:Tricorn protease homolog n=1 Tax=Flavilitoribacter nigricans (strain ATCC 23147 / DSM 23189 / NBRC 102662 / NCIMB 1420 / SS-2) TaxID=1122177 RepID=A0A2D0NA32_FLAN2|nr:S41 family peptidase [Flavilitoribacter nigricans]PHN05382.1 protease [Flavilitoribacter nigricans DSM 23189 = NBRC 102662]